MVQLLAKVGTTAFEKSAKSRQTFFENFNFEGIFKAFGGWFQAFFGVFAGKVRFLALPLMERGKIIPLAGHGSAQENTC